MAKKEPLVGRNCDWCEKPITYTHLTYEDRHLQCKLHMCSVMCFADWLQKPEKEAAEAGKQKVMF